MLTCGVMYLWLGLLVSALAADGCPGYCLCDDVSVTCEGLHNTSWQQLISDLPGDTQHLVLTASVFPEETRISQDQNISRGQDNLTYLEVRNSSLAHLNPSDFSLIPNVEHLVIVNGSFTNVTFKLLSKLVQVKRVDLSHNRLRSIPRELLDSWTYLKHLGFHDNRLSEFNFIVVQNATSLESVDLSNNQITFVHPVVGPAENRSEPAWVNLRGNQLRYLHPSVVENLSHPLTLSLGDNPWDCHCGIRWFSDLLLRDSVAVRVSDSAQIRCESPEGLRSRPVSTLARPNTTLLCEPPEVLTNTSSEVLARFMSPHTVLDCEVTGVPPPSVYWETPLGPVLHPDNRYWAPVDVTSAPQSRVHSVSGGLPGSRRPPTLHAHQNGSLSIHNLRYRLSGEYVCVAVNPRGAASLRTNITLTVPIHSAMAWSLVVGGAGAAGCLLVGVLAAAVMVGVRRVSRRRAVLSLDVAPVAVDDPDDDDDDLSEDSFYVYRASPWRSPRASPLRSPVKCVTPAEGFDQKTSEGTANIRETLETVRVRLRANMDRIRTRAQNVRRSIRHVRTTTGQYMKKVQHKSSSYAHKVRDGVALGVEQVKGHVLSIREFCGTGDLAHTISTVSMATDVDSQQTHEVVKTFTFV